MRPLLLALLFSSLCPAQETIETRDPWLWPFAEDSIWNRPIGSEAVYLPAGLEEARRVATDPELFFVIPADAPERPLFAPGSWNQRATGTKATGPDYRKTLPIPDDLLVPDARQGSTPNHCATLLLPDGMSLVQLSPMTRVERGGPVFGYCWQGERLDGSGIRGSHAGSGLSAIGGSLRRGEVADGQPIRHALKINIWCQRFVAFNDDGTPGWRWPASTADSYAPQRYAGKVPALEMGALLAIPPAATPVDLGIETELGERLFATLQDYGAYVVDDAAWDCHYLCAEAGVENEIAVLHGDQWGKSGPFFEDIHRLFKALQVIHNNAPGPVAGGGLPRRPLAPALRYLSLPKDTQNHSPGHQPLSARK